MFQINDFAPLGNFEINGLLAELDANLHIEFTCLLHSVSGDVDLIAVAVTASVTEMDQVIDGIGALDGVERTTSSIILSTKFER